MTGLRSSKRSPWIVVVLVLGCLNVLQLFRTRSFLEEARVRFVYLGEGMELREEGTAQIGTTQFEVSLRADEVPGFDGSPLGDLRPYVRLVVRNRVSGKGRPEVDLAKLKVSDSEGHQFRVVGVWPGKGFPSLRRIEYRYYLDAVEFNTHVKYQNGQVWPGMLGGQGWGPKERYTFRLSFPLKYMKEKRTVKIDQIVCFPTSGRWNKRYTVSRFRRSYGLTFSEASEDDTSDDSQ